MSRSFVQSKFLTWACRSLIGNIVLSELSFGLTLLAVCGAKAYSDGDLTIRFGILIVVVSVMAGLLGGVMLWFGLARPLLAKRSDGRDH